MGPKLTRLELWCSLAAIHFLGLPERVVSPHQSAARMKGWMSSDVAGVDLLVIQIKQNQIIVEMKAVCSMHTCWKPHS
jgi:hypothetical protein